MSIEQDVLDELNRDWQRVAPLTVAGLGPGHALLAAVPTDPDRVLLALIRAQQAGTPGAGRVVVQAMLGKLVLMAARDDTASLSDYAAELWLRIAGYPVARRPRRVAANLALDTRKRVRLERRRAARQVPVDPRRFGSLRRGNGRGAAQVLGDATRLGLIDEHTRSVLATVYVDGLSSAEAARRFGCSAEAVRWRCSRALRMLAGHAEELAS